jgi:hypothetical protein
MPFVIGFGLGAVLDDFEHLERREEGGDTELANAAPRARREVTCERPSRYAGFLALVGGWNVTATVGLIVE